MKLFQKNLLSFVLLFSLFSCNTNTTNQADSSNSKPSLGSETIGQLDSIVSFDYRSRRITGRTDYTYDDSQNLKTETIYQGRMFDNWSIILKTEYTYRDSLKTEELKKRFKSRTKEFAQEFKKTFQYDDQGMLIEKKEFYWSQNQWSPQSVTNYAYDKAIKKTTTETTYRLKESKKIKTKRTRYSYNDKGIITHGTQEDFFKNKWVKKTGKSFDYKADLPYQRESIDTMGEDAQKTVIIDKPSANTKSMYFYQKQKEKDWELRHTQTLYYDPAFPNTDYSSFEEDWSTVKTDSSILSSKGKILTISNYYWSNPK